MPVYEYRCNICNIQFELRQKFSDPPADRCPKCGGTVSKMVSAVSFSLKGAGWFGDGYGAKAEPANATGETVAGTGTTTTTTTEKEVASSAAAPTTASLASQASAPTQAETKGNASETPTATRDKAEVKSQGD